jgi:uncharacterized membrane protein YqgA involved in biofilm formation
MIGGTGTLYIKALLDGVASIAFTSTIGIGVLFSAASVFLVQGSIILLSSNLVFLQRPDVLGPITSTGGLLIIAINVLNIAKIRVGNFQPALAYAVLITMTWR